MMSIFVLIWGLVSVLLGYEFWALHSHLDKSLLHFLQKSGWLNSTFELTSAPGRPYSLWLGWIGLGAMILMNAYSLRKRSSLMSGWGGLQKWLNFHVFCGLIGPTFILFHCDFKVRGLVAISFWSMMVSFSSGIIGRYLYVNLLRGKAELGAHERSILKVLDEHLLRAKVEANAGEREKYLASARRLAGLPEQAEAAGTISAFFSSLIGSVRMMFKDAEISPRWPPTAKIILNEYAVNRRKISYYGPFQTLMGHWHTFHFPFAVFMYVAAAFHVAAAMIFGI